MFPPFTFSSASLFLLISLRISSHAVSFGIENVVSINSKICPDFFHNMWIIHISTPGGLLTLIMDSYGSSLPLKVLYMLFCSPCYADMEYFINSFGMVNLAIFLISGDTRLTEYKIQLQTILMLLQIVEHELSYF